MTIIQQKDQQNSPLSLDFLEDRTGRSAEDIQATIKKLVQRQWLVVRDKQLKIKRPLF